MVVLVQKWLSSGKSGFFRTMWLYSGKLVVFGQDDYICVKMVVLGKSGFIWAKVVVFVQIDCKLVDFGQSACARSNWL